jgi:hypothetical protein
MYSARGIYSQLTPLHPSIYAAASTTVQSAWKNVAEIQVKWQVAREELGVMTDAVTHAKARDAENAAKAVAAGKPIPKSLELQATDAVHEKTREVAALADLADKIEREFMEVMRDESEGMVATFTVAADEAVTELLSKIDDLDLALADYSVYLGAWIWLRGAMSGSLNAKRLTMSMHGVEQDTRSILGWIAEDLRKTVPSYVLKRERDTREAWEKEMSVRQTTDGIVIDRAAYAELNG